MAGRRIRILHIVHSLGYGGMESRIARLARGLPRETHEVEVLSLGAASTGRLELAAGIPHTLFPIPSGLHPLLLLRLAGVVRRGRYDIVHTHNWSSMFYGVAAAALAGGPVIVHGEHGLNRADLAGIPWKRLTVQRLFARIADWIVPVNEVIAAHVRKAWKLDDRKLTVIPNGVDLERFASAPAPSEAEAFVLGMVGRLDDVKDIGCALRALRLLADRGEGAGLRLILVGEGPMREKLAAQAEELGLSGNVEFTGARSDVQSWYPRFHVYLNTSVYEGMCNTLLEAMACRLPLAVSRVAGNAAWIREGDNALFFEPGDAQGLAGCIARLREDPALRAAISERNRLRVEAEFDNHLFIQSYARLYAHLLHGRKPPA